MVRPGNDPALTCRSVPQLLFYFGNDSKQGNKKVWSAVRREQSHGCCMETACNRGVLVLRRLLFNAMLASHRFHGLCHSLNLFFFPFQKKRKKKE
jgi:hypothetical protein